MFGLSDLKFLLEQDGMNSEYASENKFVDVSEKTSEIAISSKDKKRSVIFYEWFEQPNIEGTNDVLDNFPSINVKPTKFDSSFPNFPHLHNRLTKITAKEILTWVKTGELPKPNLMQVMTWRY